MPTPNPALLGRGKVSAALGITGEVMDIVARSVLTCPLCSAQSVEEMPVSACVYFFECKGCHTRLRPKPGDCCVFCSYGSVKCPPMQRQEDCCRTS